jgi:hypothetical protein
MPAFFVVIDYDGNLIAKLIWTLYFILTPSPLIPLPVEGRGHWADGL